MSVLLTFLITWAFINKRESGDNSIFKSNIKAYNAEGRIQLYEDEEDGFPQSPGQKEEETVPSDGERDVNMAALKPVVITPSTPVERIASRPSSPSATAATADPLPMASPASTASLPLAYAATKAFAEAYPSMGTVNIAKPSKPANIAATTKHSTSTGTTSPA
ncbi:hypothetical protein QFC19_001026 [Naganishia cerealis]|uniref:Uncharacterized protein n=1 Tax=Naganishia cerealis TaxID=610337 RepID=A0ACC2WJ53_9TREE|nr:hypothetical protein QFC19_001026 [Naganishia cerealis]